MKKLAITTLLIGGSAAYAGYQEVDSGIFYVKHVQDGYSYEFSGLEMNYNYTNQYGINYSTKFQTNTCKKHPFVSFDQQLSYKWGDDKFSYYPLVGMKQISHLVERNDEGNLSLNFAWSNMGMGFTMSLHPTLEINFETKFGVNLLHTIILEDSDRFIGNKFAKVNVFENSLKLIWNPWKDLQVEGSGFYVLDANKNYTSRGLALTTGWRF